MVFEGSRQNPVKHTHDKLCWCYEGHKSCSGRAFLGISFIDSGLRGFLWMQGCTLRAPREDISHTGRGCCCRCRNHCLRASFLGDGRTSGLGPRLWDTGTHPPSQAGSLLRTLSLPVRCSQMGNGLQTEGVWGRQAHQPVHGGHSCLRFWRPHRAALPSCQPRPGGPAEKRW